MFLNLNKSEHNDDPSDGSSVGFDLFAESSKTADVIVVRGSELAIVVVAVVGGGLVNALAVRVVL